jgi:hypothetical protein
MKRSTLGGLSLGLTAAVALSGSASRPGGVIQRDRCAQGCYARTTPPMSLKYNREAGGGREWVK